jgi:hypothetical protein
VLDDARRLYDWVLASLPDAEAAGRGLISGPRVRIVGRAPAVP